MVRVFTQHSKGGFCLGRPKLPPWNQCLLKTALREKQRRKESFLKAERRGRHIAGFLVMFTAPSNVPWLVGKSTNCNLKDSLFSFLTSLSVFFHQCAKKSVKCLQCKSNHMGIFVPCQLIQTRLRGWIHSGSWSHLPSDIAVQKAATNATTIHQLGTARPSAGDHKAFSWAFAASQNSPTLYAPRPGWHHRSLKETASSERLLALLWVLACRWLQEVVMLHLKSRVTYMLSPQQFSVVLEVWGDFFLHALICVHYR